jgi:flagellar hook-basal body complex protein FliE
MSDPVGLIGAGGGVSPLDGRRSPAVGPADPGQSSFKDALLRNLEEVDRLQQDASAAAEDLMAGRRTDLEGVLMAVQKADTAFRAVQSIRNKVIQAYEEIQQMRV